MPPAPHPQSLLSQLQARKYTAAGINVLKPPKNSQWELMAPRVIAHLPRQELYKLFLKLFLTHSAFEDFPSASSNPTVGVIYQTPPILLCMCVFTPFPCLCFWKPCPSFRTHLKPSSKSFLAPFPTPKGKVIPSSLCSQSLSCVILHHRPKSCCNKVIWLHISFLLV